MPDAEHDPIELLRAGTDALSRLRIIIAEDDELAAQVMWHQLAALGIQDIVVTANGRQALAAHDVTPADVLISDINMPIMDGVELLRHVAARGNRPDVVLVTGVGARILRTASQLAQAHGLRLLGALSKPVDPDQLHELLTRHLLERVNGHRDQTGPLPLQLTPDRVRQGLSEGCLVPHFQPKVCARSGEVRGVEALARWAEEDRILHPGSFIGVAERAGLIKQVTRTMVYETLAIAGGWHRAGVDLSIALNVSVIDVEDVSFFDFMVTAAADHGISPRRIVLEVTESRIVNRVAMALETLTRLRLRGFQLAVDDYGTGASTLEQVRRLPVDEIKIDRAFVDGASSDPALRAMLASTVTLAQQLELRTVAEGIENAADLDLARDLGVDLVQGYAIARPRPAEDFLEWLRDRTQLGVAT